MALFASRVSQTKVMEIDTRYRGLIHQHRWRALTPAAASVPAFSNALLQLRLERGSLDSGLRVEILASVPREGS